MKKIFTLLLMVLALNNLNAQCSANFSYTLNPGGNVTFSNTSVSSGTNPIYAWDFGDNQYSTAVNPTHTYAGNGTYMVKLMINDSVASSFCTNTYSTPITITSTACIVSANVNTVQSTGNLVYFNDASTGTTPFTTFTLNYGDNSSVSTFSATFSTSHTYSAAGNYFVYLQVANSPTCISTYSAIISVITQTCNLAANFNFSVNAGSVSFTNTSTGTSSSTVYYWMFDNSNTSTAQNPTPQTYLYNGTYTVILSAMDSITNFCSSTISKTIAITNAPCFVSSAFNMSKDSTQMPAIVWNAYPSYPLNVVSAVWSWGDNTSTTALYPSHTYSAAGMYSVCLTVSVSCGSTSTTCFSALINRGGEANQIATIHVINLSTGIKTQEKALLSNFVIQPNPNNGMFSIKNLNNDYQSLNIYNQLGQETYSKNVSDLSDVNLELDLPNGIYFMQLSSGSSKQTKKIIINK